MKSALVRLVGFPATLIHGDTLVLDRWRWLRARLSRAPRGRLLDVGCGTGAFTIGASRLGYDSLGLSWDERNQRVAQERARMSRATRAIFQVVDVRKLDVESQFVGQFEVAICLETMEHILDDGKLMRDIAATLRPGGRLLLTTPYLHYRAITPSDDGPFSTYEDGWHVRRGYDEDTLRRLARDSGLVVEEISYCSGYLSQKVTGVLRRVGARVYLLGWLLVLPLRMLPPLLDGVLGRVFSWPPYSICLSARLPMKSSHVEQQST